MKFTYSGYLQFCQMIIENGYQIKSYHDQEMQGDSKSCILRHDIDFSMEKAKEMALFEQDHGICSAYLVLVTGENYNIFTKKNRRLLREIFELGHTVGLHFDETVYEKDISKEQLIEYILRERNLLESVVEAKVDVVSMHEPSKHILEMNLQIPEMINSYSQKYFHEYKYLSDSMMRWREDAEAIVREGQYQKLQILTHPFWYQETEKQRKVILEDYIAEASFERKRMISEYYPEIV